MLTYAFSGISRGVIDATHMSVLYFLEKLPGENLVVTQVYIPINNV